MVLDYVYFIHAALLFLFSTLLCYVYLFYDAPLCLLFPRCCAMTIFPRRPTMSTFSMMLHYVFFFHAAALCLSFSFCSCAMATFSTQLCYVSFVPAAPLRLLSCADPGIFVGGGGGGVQVNPTKKALTTFFSL